MMKKNLSFKVALGWLAVTMLSMAVSAPTLAHDARGSHRTASSHSASKSQAKSSSMTMAPGKPNDSGVDLQYRLNGTPQIGRAVSVALLFNNITDSRGATVSLSADSGLTIQGSSALELPPGKSTAATVSVLSESEGLAYLNVFIKQNNAMSAISIPVQTGRVVAPLMKSSGELKQAPGGETLIVMPAKQ